MITLLISLTVLWLAISIALIIVQRSKNAALQQELYQLKIRETEYLQLKIEHSKLEERCNILQQSEDQLKEISYRCAQIEKEKVALETRLAEEQKYMAEQIKTLKEAENHLIQAFKAASADALTQNNQNFIELAKAELNKFHDQQQYSLSMNLKNVSDLTSPIKTALDSMGVKLGELEKSRVGAYESLRQQLQDSVLLQNNLKNEIAHLRTALNTPHVRGHWGEVQLRRVVELAGMLDHCDFEEQVSSRTEDNVRADMIIRFPDGKNVVVDSKAPLSAYLQSLGTKDEQERARLLQEHSKHLRQHINELAKKQYWVNYTPSPEFVVLFLPGEIFYSIAMEHDPQLMEFAMHKRVLVTSPTTLLALLWSVAWGWKQEKLASNAQQIIKMGQDLYDRLVTMSSRIDELGNSIKKVVKNYNDTVASVESRVLVAARKFPELTTSGRKILELSEIDNTLRLPKK